MLPIPASDSVKAAELPNPIVKNQGSMSTRKIVLLAGALFLVAIASLTLLAMGIGALVHTYTNMPFSPNLAHALGTIGNAFPNYPLALPISFLVAGTIGMGFIIFARYKFHNPEKQPKDNEPIGEGLKIVKDPATVETAKLVLPENLRKSFSKANTPPNSSWDDPNLLSVTGGHYDIWSHFVFGKEDDEKWFYVVNTDEGRLCSKLLSWDKRQMVEAALIKANFIIMPKLPGDKPSSSSHSQEGD